MSGVVTDDEFEDALLAESGLLVAGRALPGPKPYISLDHLADTLPPPPWTSRWPRVDSEPPTPRRMAGGVSLATEHRRIVKILFPDGAKKVKPRSRAPVWVPYQAGVPGTGEWRGEVRRGYRRRTKRDVKAARREARLLARRAAGDGVA